MSVYLPNPSPHSIDAALRQLTGVMDRLRCAAPDAISAEMVPSLLIDLSSIRDLLIGEHEPGVNYRASVALMLEALIAYGECDIESRLSAWREYIKAAKELLIGKGVSQ
jgi:hypothetical protein